MPAQKFRREPLGPPFVDMFCMNCGTYHWTCFYDKGGVPYGVCTLCKFRILGLSMEFLRGMIFVTDLISHPEYRQRWIEARGQEMPEATVRQSKIHLVENIETVAVGKTEVGAANDS